MTAPRRPRVTTSHAARSRRAAWAESEFESFYRDTSPALWRYLCRVAGDGALADDVLQESYLRVLAKPGRSADPRSRRAYLFTVASNLLRDRWRRRKREAAGLAALFAGGEDTWTVAPAAERRGADADVRAVLARLAPRQRALLWLAIVEGYRHREIARILGVRVRSVKVMLHRAKKKLAALLAEAGYRREPADTATPPTGSQP